MSTRQMDQHELRQYLTGLDTAAFIGFCEEVRIPAPRDFPNVRKWRLYYLGVLLAAKDDHPAWYEGILRVAASPDQGCRV